MDTGNTGRAKVPPWKDISSNHDEQCIGDRSPKTPASSATPIVSATPTATDETPRLEGSVEQVQTYLTAVNTQRDTLISKLDDYKVTVHNLDADSKRTTITVSALSKHVEEMSKENDTPRTENLFITNQS